MVWTNWFIVATIVIWIVYDIYIYIRKGNAATESATTWRFAYTLPSVPWTVGILMGHLFLQNHAPTPVGTPIPPYNGYAQVAILILTLTWIAFDLIQYNKTQTGCGFSEWLWSMAGHMTWIPLVAGGVVGAVFFQMHEPTVPLLGGLMGVVIGII